MERRDGLLRLAEPIPEAMEFIAARTGALVEIGAGTGFWARRLRQAGVRVMAYDTHPRGLGVRRGDHVAAARHGWAMLAVWPPDGIVVQEWILAAPWSHVFLVAHETRVRLGDALRGYALEGECGLPPGPKGCPGLRCYRRL